MAVVGAHGPAQAVDQERPRVRRARRPPACSTSPAPSCGRSSRSSPSASPRAAPTSSTTRSTRTPTGSTPRSSSAPSRPGTSASGLAKVVRAGPRGARPSSCALPVQRRAARARGRRLRRAHPRRTALWLKHEPVIDLGVVAAGFVLRAIAGGVATGVAISDWFLIVAGGASLFMVTGKRYAEQIELGDAGGAHRATLDGVHARLPQLRRARWRRPSRSWRTACGRSRTRRRPATQTWFQLSIVPFVLAILRYALRGRAGPGRRARGRRPQRPRPPGARPAVGRHLRDRRLWLSRARPARLLTGWGRTAPTAAGGRRPSSTPARPTPRSCTRAGRGASSPAASAAATATRPRTPAAPCVDATALDRDPRRSTSSAGHGPGRRGRQPRRADAAPGPARLVRRRSRPGTRHVTVGGAIAADIHGKNHHVDGSFAQPRRRRSRSHTADGRRRASPPTSDPELFWATAGGMGLTGVVTEATLRLLPVETSLISVDTERAADLDDVMARMVEGDDALPLLGGLDRLPRHRGARSAGRCSPAATTPRSTRSPRRQRDPGRSTSPPASGSPRPPWAPNGLLNRFTVRAFNEVWFRKAPRHQVGHLESIAALLPPARRRAGLEPPLRQPRLRPVPVRRARRGRPRPCARRSSALSAAQCASFLAVLKRFGPGEPRAAVVPHAGLDARPRPPRRRPAASADLLDELDRLVARRRRPRLPRQGLPARRRARRADVPGARPTSARCATASTPPACSSPTSPAASALR